MLDFRPDLDPRTPGLVIALDEMVPSVSGYATASGEVAAPPYTTYTPAAGEVYPNVCFATRWQSQPGGIIIVGTNKKLNILHYTSGYIDVSKGGGYALGGTPVMFGDDVFGAFDLCSFGDIIIATNKDAPTQWRTALDLTAAVKFADLTFGGVTAAPQGNTCCVAANFVFIGDVGNWSTVTGSPDILAWSAIGDHTDWRVNPQVTQSSYAQFVDTPGAITAVRAFKDGIIVFKGASMYRGRYVGAGPNSPIWDFERISDKIGCVGHRSVVNIDHALVFVGWRDVYIYDGTQPRSITRGIWEWMYARNLLSGSYTGNISLLLGHNHSSHYIMFFGLSMTLIWNYKFDRWGMWAATQPIQPVPCQTNTDHFTTVTVTGVAAGVPVVTVAYDHGDISVLHLIQGVPKNRNDGNTVPHHSLTTGWMGQPNKLQTLQRITPIFDKRPSPVNGAVTVYPSMTPGDSTTSGGATMNASYRFDTLGPINANAATSNFFSFKIAFAGGTNAAARTHVIDIATQFVPAGER